MSGLWRMLDGERELLQSGKGSVGYRELTGRVMKCLVQMYRLHPWRDIEIDGYKTRTYREGY